MSKTTINHNMTSTEADIKRMALAILALSATGLAFEVILTRLFSLIFQYHYVFLVVSLAILGLSIGAAGGYVARRFNLTTGGRNALTGSALLLALVFPLVALLLAGHNSANLTVLVVGVAMLPFLLLGWINALVYARFAERSNLLYGADLIGAALGLLVVLGLLTLLGPFGATIALGVVAGLAAILLAAAESPTRRQFGAVLVVTVAVGVLALVNRATGFIVYSPENLTDAPFDKTMVYVLQDPAYEARVTATQWGPFAQVDMVEIDDPDVRYVFTDAGAGSFMLRYDPGAEDESYLDWLRLEPTYLPFEIAPVENTLVIGAGAGRDILLARMAGAETVTAVEINPAIVDITRQQADYNGNILDLPGVSTVVTDGRNFVDRSNEEFDLIYLNIVYSQAAVPSVAALAESYAFTTEALCSYWNHLSDNGQIAFVLHNGLEGVRLLMTAVEALQAEGMTIPQALSHMTLVKQPAADPTIETAVLLIAHQPWEVEAAQSYFRTTQRRGMQPLFIPYSYEELLTVLLDESVTFEEYLADNIDFNIYPTTDDRPFFYNLNHELPAAVEDLLKWGLMLAFGYLTVISLLQPRQPVHEWTRINLSLYFALLGIGFMLIEVPLIQRFGLLLGNPVLALAATLGALLVGGGLGSLFSGRFASLRLTRAISLAALGICVWILAFAVVYPALVQAVLPASLLVRVGVTVLVLLPLGFVIGMPFPGGLRLAGDADPAGVPLFWGMNAIASTLGAVLATTIALLMGFQMALWLGMAVYLFVAIFVRLTWQRVLSL